MMNTMTVEKAMFSADDYERKTGIRTLTEEDDTADDVSRDADAKADGVEVAGEDVLHGGESHKGDDVVGVVPRNKAAHVTMAFVVTGVQLNFHCLSYS